MAAFEIHLEQAKLGMHVAHREKHVAIRLGGDVGGAILVERDRNRLLQAIDVQRFRSHRLCALRHGPHAGAGIERGTCRRQWPDSFRADIGDTRGEYRGNPHMSPPSPQSARHCSASFHWFWSCASSPVKHQPHVIEAVFLEFLIVLLLAAP